MHWQFTNLHWKLKRDLMDKIKIYLLFLLSFIASAVIPNPPDLGVGSYVLYEPNTKKVLVSFNADEPVQPLSLIHI